MVKNIFCIFLDHFSRGFRLLKPIARSTRSLFADCNKCIHFLTYLHITKREYHSTKHTVQLLLLIIVKRENTTRITLVRILCTELALTTNWKCRKVHFTYKWTHAMQTRQDTADVIDPFSSLKFI